MIQVPLEHALYLAILLFLLGLYGVLKRKNILLILISIEIMLNAAGLAFVVAGNKWGNIDGQIMFLFIITVAAAEVAVGLALLLQFYQNYKSLDIEQASHMKG